MNNNFNPYQPPSSNVEDLGVNLDIVGYRKQLIPIWIKMFGWLFIISGSLVPLYVIYGAVTGVEGTFGLYGLEGTGSVTSPLPIAIMLLFVAHAVCAYGLLFGKSWGVNACIALAYISVLLCLVPTIIEIARHSSLFFRLELIILIPYLVKLHKMLPGWNGQNSDPATLSKPDSTSNAV